MIRYIRNSSHKIISLIDGKRNTSHIQVWGIYYAELRKCGKFNIYIVGHWEIWLWWCAISLWMINSPGQLDKT